MNPRTVVDKLLTKWALYNFLLFFFSSLQMEALQTKHETINLHKQGNKLKQTKIKHRKYVINSSFVKQTKGYTVRTYFFEEPRQLSESLTYYLSS